MFRLDGVRRVQISAAVAMEMGCSVCGDEWMQWRAQNLFEGRVRS
ncbi:hypothetical protein PU630_07630 [Microbacterium horticulturae]|uniref:Uncharacterized protein n=1 Tax=Microbacterium horticulturae TaxID=3028316 RepID=A0ABY8C2T8_9MICO|nr:hypothetical protein [Microbacterium sp. KACC 23027]WEG10407.1 hypothetical protein PU630_07630 [Microbacterium sp. KACC 23027]